MTSQVLTDQLSAPAIQAFVGLLRAHAATTRRLSAELVSEHGLTINDYEALLRLSRADGRQLKRVELAESLLLTASGVTRLLDGLERAGYVEKGSCPTDARVTYAVLTDAGREKLDEASRLAHRGDPRAVRGTVRRRGAGDARRPARPAAARVGRRRARTAAPADAA